MTVRCEKGRKYTIVFTFASIICSSFTCYGHFKIKKKYVIPKLTLTYGNCTPFFSDALEKVQRGQQKPALVGFMNHQKFSAHCPNKI